MKKVISPSGAKGTITAPASKSMVQRLLACAVLSNGTSKLFNYTACNDNQVAIKIITDLGAHVTQEGNSLIIESKGVQKKAKVLINMGESGLSSRLFTPLALLFSNNVEVVGEGSLTKRPFANLMQNVFGQLGIEYKDNNGFLPITLKGNIKTKTLTVDGKGGSQFLTGLLTTLPLLQEDTILNVEGLKSTPYIDLTLDILSKFGIIISHSSYKTFTIKGGQVYKPQSINIEGDWSGASCLLVAGAIAGEIEVTNLNTESKQADVEILTALKEVSCLNVTEGKSSIKISRKGGEIYKPFKFNATHCPDLFPALVALATKCKGTSVIEGVNRLATKESDRGMALKKEFLKLGINITIDGDFMHIEGGKPKGAIVEAHNDHRIAMSLATVALIAESPITIIGAECVNKSYPHFWNDLSKLSVSLQ